MSSISSKRLLMPMLFTALFGLSSISLAVGFDWATVGNPGNANDIYLGGVGRVDYRFRISKHEVTNAQYVDFLNKVDPSGDNLQELYNPQMSLTALGGINFNIGADLGSKYGIKPGQGNNPVTWVSFLDAMRFVNWLENGQGFGGTESGVYAITDGTSELRDPKSTYFIPSENEWYKAAYHKNDGVTGNYWEYPTGTDSEPYSDKPGSLNTPNDANVANFYKDDGIDNGYNEGFAITETITFDIGLGVNYLSEVGAYEQSKSSYGTFDQGGNVQEWTEAIASTTSGSTRVRRGGSFGLPSSGLRSRSSRGAVEVEDPGPGVERFDLGFRIAATVPEPTTFTLAIAALCLVGRRRS